MFPVVPVFNCDLVLSLSVHQLQPKDVVWVKYQNYPFWPAIVRSPSFASPLTPLYPFLSLHPPSFPLLSLSLYPSIPSTFPSFPCTPSFSPLLSPSTTPSILYLHSCIPSSSLLLSHPALLVSPSTPPSIPPLLYPPLPPSTLSSSFPLFLPLPYSHLR